MWSVIIAFNRGERTTLWEQSTTLIRLSYPKQRRKRFLNLMRFHVHRWLTLTPQNHSNLTREKSQPSAGNVRVLDLKSFAILKTWKTGVSFWPNNTISYYICDCIHRSTLLRIIIWGQYKKCTKKWVILNRF